jgi:hypothetical protein
MRQFVKDLQYRNCEDKNFDKFSYEIQVVIERLTNSRHLKRQAPKEPLDGLGPKKPAPVTS